MLTELYDTWDQVTQNQTRALIWGVVIIATLLLIFILTLRVGRDKKNKKRLGSGSQNMELDTVMENLRVASEQAHEFVGEQRALVGEQEREVMERQMQLQKLEEQVLQMKHEMQMLDEAPQELKDRIMEINQKSAKELKRKIQRNNYIMLLVGFLLGIVGFGIGAILSGKRAELVEQARMMLNQ